MKCIYQLCSEWISLRLLNKWQPNMSSWFTSERLYTITNEILWESQMSNHICTDKHQTLLWCQTWAYHSEWLCLYMSASQIQYIRCSKSQAIKSACQPVLNYTMNWQTGLWVRTTFYNVNSFYYIYCLTRTVFFFRQWFLQLWLYSKLIINHKLRRWQTVIWNWTPNE